MKGYAIEIRLLEWEKPEGSDTNFRELKSHYRGSFNSETADIAYQRLGNLLSVMNLVTGTKMRRIGRGKRRNRR